MLLYGHVCLIGRIWYIQFRKQIVLENDNKMANQNIEQIQSNYSPER